MAADLQQSREETAHSQRMMLALSQAAQSVQRARYPEEVYVTLGCELTRLGYHALILTKAEENDQFCLTYHTIKVNQLRKAEHVLRMKAKDIRVGIKSGSFLERVVVGGETLFTHNLVEHLSDAVSDIKREAIQQAATILGLAQGIYAPLKSGDNITGLLIVSGSKLLETDLLAVTAFANQTSIALDNARLYQETRAWTDELEQRVEARTTALRESEERFRSTFEQAAEGVTQVTPEGKYIRVNQRFCEIVGYSQEELSSLSFQDITYPEDLEADLENVRNILANKIKKFKMVKRYVRKDRSPVWVNLTSSLVRDIANQPKYFISVIEDITQQKQMEAELQQKNVELERSNRELEQFAYVASHDLQEPLRMVSSYVQLLQRRYQGKLGTDADEFIDFAVDGATRMQLLINDLLAFSRVGTRGEEFSLVSCEEVLEEVLFNLKTIAQENQAVITHDPLPAVMGDHTQLDQLFQNLVGNAIKFHRKEPPQVHISAELLPPTQEKEKPMIGGWRFSVRDNGIGIQSNQLNRIFVIFQRLHGRNEFPGTGIGLAICKKIVERHGGNIWVDSEPGKGSTFFFTLPEVKR
jgi:PAS domain S-box-containing protein